MKPSSTNGRASFRISQDNNVLIYLLPAKRFGFDVLVGVERFLKYYSIVSGKDDLPHAWTVDQLIPNCGFVLSTKDV